MSHLGNHDIGNHDIGNHDIGNHDIGTHGIAPDGIAPDGIAPDGIAPDGIAPLYSDTSVPVSYDEIVWFLACSRQHKTQPYEAAALLLMHVEEAKGLTCVVLLKPITLRSTSA